MELCGETIQLGLNADAVEHYADSGVHYVACGMYELQDDGRRAGAIAMYTFDQDSLTLIPYASTTTTTEEDNNITGVFDIKWNRAGRLAAACADGTVKVFDARLKLTAKVVVTEGFCLAVAWLGDSSKVAVSSSNGTLTVCDVDSSEEVVLSFAAHAYPHDASMPAEIWTVAAHHNGDGSYLVASGADEGALKLWDVRLSGGEDSTATLLCVKRGAHEECGVCSLQFVSNGPLRLLSGGYDGKVRAWDCVNARAPRVLHTSEALGGGIWRIKQRGNRIFTACMRGGFRVLSFNEKDGSSAIGPLSQYTEQEPQWEALAYGADWITDDVVAGCSFYDRKLRVFRV